MSSYLKLVDESRQKNYLGLKMDGGKEVIRPTQMSRGYAYIEIPIRGILKDGELGDRAARNSYVELQAACTVSVKGPYRFEVHPNPKLLEYGLFPGMFYLESEEGERNVSVQLWLRRDLDIQEAGLDYAVRIYMRD